MRRLRGLLPAAFLAFLPLTAQAYIRVGNCDTDRSYVVHFETNGEFFDKELAPGEHYLTSARPLKIRTDEDVLIAPRPMSEYCIWNGKLRLQRNRDSQWRR